MTKSGAHDVLLLFAADIIVDLAAAPNSLQLDILELRLRLKRLR